MTAVPRFAAAGAALVLGCAPSAPKPTKQDGGCVDPTFLDTHADYVNRLRVDAISASGWTRIEPVPVMEPSGMDTTAVAPTIDGAEFEQVGEGRLIDDAERTWLLVAQTSSGCGSATEPGWYFIDDDANVFTVHTVPRCWSKRVKICGPLTIGDCGYPTDELLTSWYVQAPPSSRVTEPRALRFRVPGGCYHPRYTGGETYIP